MMDPEMLRLAQEQMSRMSPDDLARMQQQLMSNPDLIRMASESMKNMKAEDLRRAAQQMNQTRPEDMRDMTEKLANTTPEEFAAMKAQADAQMSYAISGAKMLKKQGNELHNQGQYSDAASKYKLAKDNLKNIPSSAAHTLQLQCTLNLMACYLKTGQFDECISEGSEVLTSDSSNVKAYYRRGQAYKELGKLEAAVADLSKAHEISPEDETIAEVLRDTEEKLAREGGGVNMRKGVVIEEVVEDDTSQPSSNQRSSSGYTVSQPPEGAGNTKMSESSERSRDSPASIRPSQNYVSKSDPEGLSKLGIQGMSPELVKTATDMIGTMEPEELQKMFEVASSMNATSSGGPNMGSNIPEMSPDMLKMASDMVGKMSPDELQNMMNFASQMGGPGGAPRGSENNFQSSSRATTSNSPLGSSPQTISEIPDELSNDQRMGQSSSSLPSSTADMQESMRNSMKDPAMRQMFASMMKNMNPEMMANMSEQFGMKLSKEDAAKAQQAMSSLSPEDLDRMMRWMERAQKGVDVAKKTKNWLLGRRGLILAIVMLILAFILYPLGFIGR
ncbi:Outer envelope protein 61 [Dichanthelium oligosanthes]|uniref:Outer envelope protein 61 n=1 Tax=Dichanthelium oligosanthes TaxID=888268 RepID=A0A1E5V5N7_9POAL|nr:Outer envelope protein 61 [Dichanthelium oligosanthes]